MHLWSHFITFSLSYTLKEEQSNCFKNFLLFYEKGTFRNLFILCILAETSPLLYNAACFRNILCWFSLLTRPSVNSGLSLLFAVTGRVGDFLTGSHCSHEGHFLVQDSGFDGRLLAVVPGNLQYTERLWLVWFVLGLTDIFSYFNYFALCHNRAKKGALYWHILFKNKTLRTFSSNIHYF